ncbi:hypothetical protein C8R48DRAFT_673433 [Suillus tomentosus]|nr:hypothetical protein C8R48DRAFT_680381 [Suillus tomentosus]KAG1846366.1 hypothetical protein C8R48DRAFT_677907 [Suillus tomentosus]KAG1862012.1 hypothetical protein C8R48DRAFT_673433 [Suillus tomentosus]
MSQRIVPHNFTMMHSIVVSLDPMDIDYDEHEGEGTHLEPMDVLEGEVDVAGNNAQTENNMIVDDDEADGEDAMEVCDSETENGAQPEYMDIYQDDVDVEMHAHSDDMDIDM